MVGGLLHQLQGLGEVVEVLKLDGWLEGLTLRGLRILLLGVRWLQGLLHRWFGRSQGLRFQQRWRSSRHWLLW